MKMMIYIFCVVFFIGPIIHAADIHIDPSCSTNGDGSFNSGNCASANGQPGPRNTWAGISFNAANDYFQKCGTSEILSSTLNINVSGTASNPILISAYYESGGSPVYEKDSPHFGQNCGNSAQKPIISANADGTPDTGLYASHGTLFSTYQGTINQYLELNSIQMRNAETVMYIKSNYNKVRYCYIFNVLWGIRIGISGDGDYNTIEYNYIDMDDDIDEDGQCGSYNCSVDPIKLRGLANNNIIQYNHITGFDHIGVLSGGGDGNTIQYNYIFGDLGHEDVCIGTNPQANSNIWRYNYCKDAGIGFQFGGGDNNEIYGNIFSCDKCKSHNYGCLHFYSYDNAAYSNDDNLIYNNVIYDHDNTAGYEFGIKMVAMAGNTGTINGNRFINNVIQKIGNRCIFTRDYPSPGIIGSNVFYNNSCYDYAASQYADLEQSQYSNAAAFNAHADASNNRDDNPLMNNPAAHEFWPMTGSPLINNGYTLPAPYNQLLDPDNTNFTASPPLVNTVTQPGYIGAYTHADGTPDTTPPSKPVGLSITE